MPTVWERRRMWTHVHVCALVCTYSMYVSLRLSSLIKLSCAAQVLVVVVWLIRTFRMDVLMQAEHTAQLSLLHCCCFVSHHAPKVIWKLCFLLLWFLYLLQILFGFVIFTGKLRRQLSLLTSLRVYLCAAQIFKSHLRKISYLKAAQLYFRKWKGLCLKRSGVVQRE